MRKPKRPALNRTRERRIEQEIVVDAYTPEERAMGWNYYLEEKLAFPFKARCVSLRAISPLKKGEEVEVFGMTKEEDCMHEMFVLIRFAGRKLGVQLAQIDPVKPDKATREAVEDWRYWRAMGYGF
ncbi:MAG: calcium-binding protein [Pseudomonadota bacterium]